MRNGRLRASRRPTSKRSSTTSRSHEVATEKFPGGEYETDARGIADMDGVRIAWIRDPDNQVLAIFERA